MNWTLRGAAAVVALGPVASGATIYSGVRNLQATSSNPSSFDQVVQADVNGDGLFDVGIALSQPFTMATGSVGVLGDGVSSFYAKPLGAGEMVGPTGPDWKASWFLAGVTSAPATVVGPWAPPDPLRAFGFAFSDAGGSVYYGWARVEVEFDLNGGTNTSTLVDWAYEDEAETPILTDVPEPGTLGLLALGAMGLVVLRRRR